MVESRRTRLLCSFDRRLRLMFLVSFSMSLNVLRLSAVESARQLSPRMRLVSPNWPSFVLTWTVQQVLLSAVVAMSAQL